MKQLKFGILLFVGLASIYKNKCFDDAIATNQFGLLALSYVNDTLCRLTLADIRRLDSLNINYQCSVGGLFCEVNLPLEDSARCAYPNLNKCVIEVSLNREKIVKLGVGFKFEITTHK